MELNFANETYAITDREIRLVGNISQLDAQMVDRRYSLFGKEGITFSLVCQDHCLTLEGC